MFFEVYNEVGYGFLESVYKKAMLIAIRSAGLNVEKEVPLTARFRGHIVGEFRADLVVSGRVIVEVKAAKCIDAKHEAQALNYLRTSALEVALILNFGPKPQIKRLAYSNLRKAKSPICVHLR